MAELNGSAATKPASPLPDQQQSAPSGAPAAPSTPPANTQQSQQTSQPSQQPIATTANGPASSLADPGTSTRPHDARTVHMVLSSLGVTAYQERVPLQLLDFAYRYTASVLADAQHLAAEGYVSTAAGGSGGASASRASAGAGAAGEQISLAALRLATSSRLGYQFSSGLPKQTLLDLAKDRNKIQLPDPGEKVVFGLNLPHERFVQTGTEWTMLEEWDSEGEGEDGGPGGEDAGAAANGGEDGAGEGDKDEDMEDGFEDVFGGDDEDKAMEDE